MSELLEKHKLLEYADPRVSKPDHSMLIWNINIDKIVRGNMNEEINTCEYKKYDLNNIPSSFLATHLHKIEDLISSLEVQSANCSEIDQIYSDFVNLLKVEMTENLSYKVIKMSSGLLSNKRRRIKKPWWTDKLTQLWNNVCVAEKAMLGSKSDSRKRQCRIEFIDKRKTFDREAQRAKRTHWRKQMVEIDDMETTNHSEFWKKIGRIGVGTERRKLIPMSVQLPDGTIAHGREAVVSEWKRAYCSLLNPETVNSEYVMDQRLDTEIEMNNEITSFEVVNAVRSLKRNKAKWNEDLHKDTTRRNGPGGNKLRTYRTFKQDVYTELYLDKLIIPSHRRAYSQFRCGINDEPHTNRYLAMNSQNEG
ncbi:unnamed protein product [Mytilus edulis]|uniref:Uncharacterized protein n=1 Tax=Mytilus edulis TaxID=6550 RepID=A0A8S3VQY2_MYTED|nr:unnamed protein product [Mytilus edulis]